MSNSQQEETEFGGAAVSKQRRIIHFSSGETMEEEDSEEEEEDDSSEGHPFREPKERTRFSFKTMAFLVGRISLLTCDFLGERLAAALGLNAAKYQYAIDQYHRDRKISHSQAAHNQRGGQAETDMFHLSSCVERSRYGATADLRDPEPSHWSCDETHKDRNEGFHNRGYQTDDNLK
ncbi:protein FAM177A1 isoform X2 [Antennarius striatus]|uniref:protein FAM177A1 isoform X2 n=1 Tax=Antennarius striatus TaxID=241820 RepID=UPI0035B0E09A